MSEIENLKIYGGATYTVGNQDIIANEREAGKTYVKGKSYVIREHKLYVCNVTHTSVEPFDATKWTEITIGEAIADNTTAIGDLSQLTTTDKSSLVGAVNEVVSTKQNKITYHQETVTPDSSGAFNTGLTLDKLPLSCTSANGYISGFVYSGGYWYARIVNYAGQPVTTAVTVSTWYIDNPS